MSDGLGRLVRLDLGRRAVLVVAVLVASVLVGVLSVINTEYALLAALGLLALGLVAVDPSLIVVGAVPASLLMARVGGALSVADVVLAAATAVAIVLVRGKGGMRAMQPLFWAGTVYLASAVPTLILNPYQANAVEWIHEFVLVIGSMIVGFALGRLGRAHLAAGLYVLGCVGIAIAAILTALAQLATAGYFSPVYLPELHKNFIGGALAMALVLLYARPVWFRVRSPWAGLAMLTLAVGILASQSRQAILGALAGFVIVSLRRRPDTGRFPKIVWIAAVPILLSVLMLLNDQLTEDNRFNSANQRLDWYEATIDIWLTSPVFGVGLRWWYTDRFPDAGFQPPNAEFEVISSVGIVGLIGFLVMFLIGFWALWRIDPRFGTAGAALIVTRFVQAQFDLYWVAGQASLLWIVGGMCIGALARSQAGGGEPPAEPSFIEPGRLSPPRTPRPRASRV